ncbi:somatostatin receptor type 2 isoform X2 [Octopus bimaculoides]|nr:somatostatin receptor type 2 isoform X2 [Octopus bimaculoides]
MVYSFLYNDSNEDVGLKFKDYIYVDGTEDMDRIYYPGKIENLRKPWIQEPHFILTVVVYSICFIVGLIGNGLVVFAMCADKKNRSVTTSFLVSLALADLLFLLVCVPYEVTKSSIAHWSTGIFLCKFTGFIEMLTAVGSIFNLTAVSIERYIVIVHPMRSRLLCTLGNTRKILCVLWIISIFISCPALYMMGTESQKFHNNGTEVMLIYCVDATLPRFQQLAYCIYQFVTMFVAPTFILAICYSKVIYVLWVSTKQLAQMTFTERRQDESNEEGKQKQSFKGMTSNRNYRTLASPTSSGVNERASSSECCNSAANKTGCGSGDCVSGGACKKDSPQTQTSDHKKSPRPCPVLKRMPKEQSAEVLHKRRQVIKMLLAIILIFLLCWGPKLLFRLMRRVDTAPYFTSPSLFIKIIFDFSPYIQSCINPVVYFFMSRNFRKSMRYVCHKYCHCFEGSGAKDVFELETKTMDGNSISTRAQGQQFPLHRHPSA